MSKTRACQVEESKRDSSTSHSSAFAGANAEKKSRPAPLGMTDLGCDARGREAAFTARFDPYGCLRTDRECLSGADYIAHSQDWLCYRRLVVDVVRGGGSGGLGCVGWRRCGSELLVGLGEAADGEAAAGCAG